MKISEIFTEALPGSSPAEYAPMVRQAMTAPPTPMNPYQGLSASASEFETNQQSVPNPDGITGAETQAAPPLTPAAPTPASTGPTPTGFPPTDQPLPATIGEAMTWEDYLLLAEVGL